MSVTDDDHLNAGQSDELIDHLIVLGRYIWETNVPFDPYLAASLIYLLIPSIERYIDDTKSYLEKQIFTDRKNPIRYLKYNLRFQNAIRKVNQSNQSAISDISK